MKKIEKPLKYILLSGEEELIKTSTIMEISKYLRCSYPWIYTNRYKDINKNGTWSFNFKEYNYTILTID